jgi:hypothetical protein
MDIVLLALERVTDHMVRAQTRCGNVQAKYIVPAAGAWSCAGEDSLSRLFKRI